MIILIAALGYFVVWVGFARLLVLADRRYDLFCTQSTGAVVAAFFWPIVLVVIVIAGLITLVGKLAGA